jgi:hypothetical protein
VRSFVLAHNRKRFTPAKCAVSDQFRLRGCGLFDNEAGRFILRILSSQLSANREIKDQLPQSNDSVWRLRQYIEILDHEVRHTA